MGRWPDRSPCIFSTVVISLSVRIFKNKMKQRRMRSDGILEFSYGVR